MWLIYVRDHIASDIVEEAIQCNFYQLLLYIMNVVWLQEVPSSDSTGVNGFL